MASKLYKLFRVACADLLVLQEMEYNGIVFNSEEAMKYAHEIQRKVDAVSRAFHNLGFEDCVLLSSNKHLSCVLYGGIITEDIRVPIGYYKSGARQGQVRYSIQQIEHSFDKLVDPLPKSETKNSQKVEDNASKEYSVSEDTLKQLKAKGKARQIIDFVLEYRRLEKLRSTYLEGYTNLMIENGWKHNMLHGNLNQCVAVTGRLTSTQP